MANTLTGLISSAYAAMDRVSREQVGFLGAINLDASASRAAVNQVVRVPIVPQGALIDIVPATVPPDVTGQTIGYVDMSITKSKAYRTVWTGEEKLALDNSGNVYNKIIADQMAQGFRTLTNAMEVDLAQEAVANASFAVGTPGTVPFSTLNGVGSNLGIAADLLQGLIDRGAPTGDLNLLINTKTGAALRSSGQLTKANEAGTTLLRERGILLDIFGFAIRESAGFRPRTSGTASGATTNTAGYPVGATVITLAGAGTGTLVAGDIIRFAGDNNQYGIVSSDSNVGDGGTITLGAGLQQAIPASAQGITVVGESAGYLPNVGFSRDAMVLLARPPAVPPGGDMARDRMLVTDPASGLSFDMAIYPGYRQIEIELSMAWGVRNIKPAHTGIIW